MFTMMIKPLILSLGALATAGAVSLLDRGSPARQLAQPAGTGSVPVLVELYQSQGCSSCPPANANLNAIAGRKDVIALSFAVTYWDYLGWKDIFASPAYTQRQWDYARHYDRGNVATPQIWINGRTTIVGYDARELASSIAAERSNGGPALALTGDSVRVGRSNAPAGGADVWVARYDPRVIQVPIRAGENGGRTLPHRNIVRQLVKIGHWSGPAT
ncbi:DUF1223 domain-containing protein, partial [Sphingomonas sp.]|uniref:DUF1223 domain-containing protein n=1 Tax=Sphingomonas sp. TaxID=28214 RepID=UPI0025D6805A